MKDINWNDFWAFWGTIIMGIAVFAVLAYFGWGNL